MTISMKRNLIDLDTPLGEIPSEWLIMIEPKIVRGSFLPCWAWGGTIDNYGTPLLWNKFEERLVSTRNAVAHMFYNFKDEEYFVVTQCSNAYCVHPKHILVSKTLPRVHYASKRIK